jgi:parvulin-like peptidyl-prolyl isomerase
MAKRKKPKVQAPPPKATNKDKAADLYYTISDHVLSYKLPYLFALLTVVVIVIAILLFTASNNDVPKGSVAKVAGTSISLATYNHWMTAAANGSATGGEATPVPDPPNYLACITRLQAKAPKPTKKVPAQSVSALKAECASQYKTLQGQALNYLLTAQWVINESASLGVQVSDAQVKKQFLAEKAQQFPTAAAFQSYSQSTGQTVSDLLLRTKVEMLATDIKQKIDGKVHVTEQDLLNYYRENPSLYGSSAKRNVLVISTKTKAQALAAKAAVVSGVSWAKEAKAVSIDPTKDNGGVVTGLPENQEPPSLNAAIFSAKKNVVSGPVSTVFGYYIFSVTGIIPATKMTFAQSEAEIKTNLTSTEQQAAFTAFASSFRKKYKSQTNCASGYVVSDCSGYKAPASSAPTTSSTTPVTTTSPGTVVSPSTTTSPSTVVAPSTSSSKTGVVTK